MEFQQHERSCECGCPDFKQVKTKPKWTKARIIQDDKGNRFHMEDVMCMHCGLIYKNPMLTPESMEDFYQGPYAKLFKPHQEKSISKSAINEGVIMTVYTLEWLDKIGYSLKGKEVLEVGTGMGILLKGMECEGATVDGIDADKRSVEIANKLFGANYKHLSYKDFKPEKKYDLVICNNTLEHFYSPYSVLRSFGEMLKPGGMVMLELPDALCPYPNTLVDAFLSSAHNYTFTEEAVRIMCKNTGFRVHQLDRAGHKKCMLMLLEKSKEHRNHIVDLDIDSLHQSVVTLYAEMDRHSEFLKKNIQELLGNIYVSIYIDRAKQEFPRTYNSILIYFANVLLENGKPLESLKCLNDYSDDQPEDVNTCYATNLYLQAMCYRQIGDFVKTRNFLEKCAAHYPNIRKYNFVRDLEIDGLVSNTAFAPYLWWNAERILQSYG